MRWRPCRLGDLGPFQAAAESKALSIPFLRHSGREEVASHGMTMGKPAKKKRADE